MMIVKVGGADGNDMDNVLIDVAPRKDYVLVHGGSKEVDSLAAALGRPPKFLTSPSGVVSRYTDAQTMEVFTMALAGKLNTQIVARLQSMGAKALDNGRTMLVRDDHSGTIEQVNVELLEVLLKNGYVPVICPPALTEQGELINTDADRVAAKIASALRAETLLLFTNVPGLLREPSDPSTLIKRVPRDQLDYFMNFAYGRMKKKLIAAKDALEAGVS